MRYLGSFTTPSWLWFSAVLSTIACGGNPSADAGGRAQPVEGEGGTGNGGESSNTQFGGGAIIDFGGNQGTGGSSTSSCTGDGCNANRPDSFCGDGVVGDDEGCDDGNAIPGDGCDGVCRLEFGYECPDPGKACKSTLSCGDGLAGTNEACDDGNANSGDGCSSNCSVENGYVCDAFGKPCVRSTAPAVCGNSDVEYGETCDDGGTVDGDGCSAKCQIETGYTCPSPGEPCEKNEFCGDGILNGKEQCDDGNAKAGDCCTGTCKLEANCLCTTPTVAHNPPHQDCASTVVCGDGKVTGDEFCDDGNTDSSDGCKGDCSDAEAGYVCPATGGVCTMPTAACGNEKLDAGETCDDGNRAADDGCAADCTLESGWVCTAPTATSASTCNPLLYCGDGIVTFSRGETCDDGDDPTSVSANGDGCSNRCTVESGYTCSGSPSICGPSVVCGDKKIGAGEECDDGNATNNDGCSSTCHAESGYVCPFVGIACQPVCGDGLVRGSEQCDDGNLVATVDGCSASCTVDTPTDQESNGWVCATNPANCTPSSCPSVCTRTVCGNGTREGSEQCDDGNNDMGDGCTPFCRLEPVCPVAGGACNTSCGDGILLATDTDECDDGNTVSGDGCSATCKVEAGYSCEKKQVTKTSLILPIVLRDFRAWNGGKQTNGHPDFETYSGDAVDTNIVQLMLDGNGKPQHVLLNKATTANEYTDGKLTSSDDYFASWYRDDSLYNQTFVKTLTFSAVDSAFQYSNKEFFPLTGFGWDDRSNDNFGVSQNFHFTSEVRYWFEYRGNETLEFVGDDDVWVFVNKKLAVDLGGLHPALSGSIVLDVSNGKGTVCEDAKLDCDNPRIVDLGLELGKVYEIVVFQAERHTTASNYTLTLGNFNATRSVCSPICGDGVVTAREQCDLGSAKNDGSYGGCKSDCTLAAYCGDHTVDKTAGEACDDGVNATAYASSASSGCGPDCKYNHYCGDGSTETDYGESCDQGNANSASAYGLNLCLNNCTPAPYCGDGFTNGTEQCDKGSLNGAPGSNCDGTCRIACGNGTLDAGEQCDKGTANNTGAYGGCRSNCTLAGYCGDGFTNGAEQCDDGKNDGSYGTCDSDCTVADYCGDGFVNTAAGELCDNGAKNVTSGYGTGLCTTRCRPASYCGDNSVDTENHEACDDGANNSNTVAGACKLDCSGYSAPPSTCGNGVKNSGEDCDDGANNGKTTSLCDVRCQYKCGNGLRDSGEECDDGTNNGSYGTCKPDCTLADYCGDGTKNGSEQCDNGLEGNEDAPYGRNLDGSYKCTTACQIAPYCGDDRVYSSEEECDGQTGCLGTCRWDTTILL